MAPKPRGLKASSKSQSTPVPTPTPTPSAPSDSTPTDSTKRPSSSSEEVPLDENGLSIRDLFELRSNALDLLLLPEPTEEQVEEARGLLRGILHGTDSLIRLLLDVKPGDTIPAHDLQELLSEDSDRSEEEDDDGSLEYNLGLKRVHANARIGYLTAFALHELGKLVPPPPSGIDSIRQSGGKKKLKIDMSEPTKSSEWFTEAERYYDYAYTWFEEELDGHGGVPWAEHWYVGSITSSDRARLVLDTVAASENNIITQESAIDAIRKAREYIDKSKRLLGWVQHYRSVGYNPYEFPLTDYPTLGGEPSLVSIRTMETLVAFIDRYMDIITPSVAVHTLREVMKISSSHRLTALVPERPNDSEARDFVEEDEEEGKESYLLDTERKSEGDVERYLERRSILKGDAALVLFTILEDAVEDEYRPEGEDEDEEEEVKSLPDVEQVRGARKEGEKTIELLRQTVELLDKDDQKKKRAQLSKLEEAYLLYSALINPDDKEKLKENESAVEKIHQEQK